VPVANSLEPQSAAAQILLAAANDYSTTVDYTPMASVIDAFDVVIVFLRWT
jgi:hypothetical protein